MSITGFFNSIEMFYFLQSLYIPVVIYRYRYILF